MEEIKSPKTERAVKQQEDTWIVGPGEKFESLEEIREKNKEGKDFKKEKNPERPKRHSKAEEGKTPGELEEDARREIEEARGDVNRLYSKGVFKKEEPTKGAEEIIRGMVVAEIPEKYKKRIGDLIGRDDEVAAEKRDGIPVLKYAAMALAGTASFESRQFVKDNLENRLAWPWLHFALMGDNTKHAWEIREEMLFDRKVDNEGIVVRKKVRGENWWKLIEKTGLNKSKSFENLVDGVNSFLPWPGLFMAPRHILRSTTGIRLDESPEKASVIAEYGKSAPLSALECLTGDNSSQAKEKAAEICGKDPKLKDAYTAYLESVEPGVTT